MAIKFNKIVGRPPKRTILKQQQSLRKRKNIKVTLAGQKGVTNGQEEKGRD